MWPVRFKYFLRVFDHRVGATAPTSGFGSQDSDFWKQLVELCIINFIPKKIKFSQVISISQMSSQCYNANP